MNPIITKQIRSKIKTKMMMTTIFKWLKAMRAFRGLMMLAQRSTEASVVRKLEKKRKREKEYGIQTLLKMHA